MTLYQTPSRYITNLLWCNPSALFHSWQSVTLTKKLWNKSKRLPIPRQLEAEELLESEELKRQLREAKEQLKKSEP